MIFPLPLTRIELGAGRTVALTVPCGAAIRVVQGKVWATTSGSREDVWLSAGEEHRVLKRGLTVLEAADRKATVEVAPPVEPGPSAIERTICAIAALAMTALTLVALVILPAQIDAGVPASTMAASSDVETLQSSGGTTIPPYSANATMR